MFLFEFWVIWISFWSVSHHDCCLLYFFLEVWSMFHDHVSIFYSILQEQVFSENDAFFAWTFVKRRPLWQTLLSFFWPVLTLAICLFPVYPHQCKLLILYSCAGVLLLILSLLSRKFFSVNISYIFVHVAWVVPRTLLKCCLLLWSEPFIILYWTNLSLWLLLMLLIEYYAYLSSLDNQHTYCIF